MPVNDSPLAVIPGLRAAQNPESSPLALCRPELLDSGSPLRGVRNDEVWRVERGVRNDEVWRVERGVRNDEVWRG